MAFPTLITKIHSRQPQRVKCQVKQMKDEAQGFSFRLLPPFPTSPTSSSLNGIFGYHLILHFNFCEAQHMFSKPFAANLIWV